MAALRAAHKTNKIDSFIFFDSFLKFAFIDRPRKMTIQHFKELLTNTIPLPHELINVIKSYAFYDIKTANMLKQIKFFKQKTNNLIREALTDSTIDQLVSFQENPSLHIYSSTTLSRFLPILDDILFIRANYPDNWGFGFILHPTETLQIQGYNCLTCGNYKIVRRLDKICCFCHDD